jgi:hypothetical protein
VKETSSGSSPHRSTKPRVRRTSSGRSVARQTGLGNVLTLSVELMEIVYSRSLPGALLEQAFVGIVPPAAVWPMVLVDVLRSLATVAE